MCSWCTVHLGQDPTLRPPPCKRLLQGAHSFWGVDVSYTNVMVGLLSRRQCVAMAAASTAAHVDAAGVSY